MRNANDPEPRSLERWGSDEHLSLQAVARTESSLVEDLRRERAEARCQPPGLGQEDATVGGNGLVSTEDVVESRHVRSLGMAPLLRLLELLRITEENNALRSVRHGQDVC